MAVRKICLLGESGLYEAATEVAQEELSDLKSLVDDMHDTLAEFRERHGYGRAMAAPQIGVKKRLIYMEVDEPVVIINPLLHNLSKETIDVWDNCLSFPGLTVKVSRHRTCSLVFRNLEWEQATWELEGAMSELIQHECDHLDGILATQRAIDDKSFRLMPHWTRLAR